MENKIEKLGNGFIYVLIPEGTWFRCDKPKIKELLKHNSLIQGTLIITTNKEFRVVEKIEFELVELCSM